MVSQTLQMTKQVFSFSAPGLERQLVSKEKGKVLAPAPSTSISCSPSSDYSSNAAHSSVALIKKSHSSSHLEVIVGVGLELQQCHFHFYFLLILLIHPKMRELENSDAGNQSQWNRTLSSRARRNLHEWNKGRF